MTTSKSLQRGKLEQPEARTEDLDLKEIVSEIPDEVLIGSLVDRIQREPSSEVMKVVATAQSFRGPF